jgi:hypothetical protein
MNIIFLDFDGVLNSAQSSVFWSKQGHPYGLVNNKVRGYNRFCPIAMSNLNYILEASPETNVVISSSWRLGNTFEELKIILTENGFAHPDRLIGVTPHLPGKIRGNEIDQWFTDTDLDVSKYVIIDDDSDMGDMTKYLVQTHYGVGLSWVEIEKVLELLK